MHCHHDIIVTPGALRGRAVADRLQRHQACDQRHAQAPAPQAVRAVFSAFTSRTVRRGPANDKIKYSIKLHRYSIKYSIKFKNLKILQNIDLFTLKIPSKCQQFQKVSYKLFPRFPLIFVWCNIRDYDPTRLILSGAIPPAPEVLAGTNISAS